MSTRVEVAKLPPCDFCKFVGPPPRQPAQLAQFDGKTTEGPWANMCRFHFDKYGVGLGTGKGQRLIAREGPR